MRTLLLCLIAICLPMGMAQAAEFRIPVEKHKLKNGLRLVLSRDTAAPVVSVYLVFGVGARFEEKGRTGFAHLFEHMMFQGSTNAPKGVHFKTVESNGGYLNGSTHYDYTDYYEVLPSNQLPVALWLESDRMRGLAITPGSLANQKEAVKEERRLSLDNQPYATAIVELWPPLIYRNFSNAHSLIGSFEDLNAATVEDVSRFFKTHYAPNNAVLVLVGDIAVEEAKKLVEKYFADIAPQPQPAPPALSEPPPDGERTAVHEDPHAAVPGVIIVQRGPKRRSPDYYAMQMLDVVLTGGDSSRFQQNLVKGKQSVIQFESNLAWPFGDVTDYKDPGVYGMFLVHNPSFTGKQIVAQVSEEIADIHKKGVPEKELARARTYLRASTIKRLQSTISRAKLLGQYELFDGDAGLINTELNEFLKVGAAQIQAVAGRYFESGSRAVLEIVPSKKGESK